MITGRGPFDHVRGFAELLMAHAMAPPPPPSTVATQMIPPELDHIILRALAKRPEDRFANAAEFSVALAATYARRSLCARFDTEPLPSPSSPRTAPCSAPRSAPRSAPHASPSAARFGTEPLSRPRIPRAELSSSPSIRPCVASLSDEDRSSDLEITRYSPRAQPRRVMGSSALLITLGALLSMTVLALFIGAWFLE